MTGLKTNTVVNITNRKYLEKHIRYMELRGLSESRKQNVVIRMRKILNEYIPNKDFQELTREELEDISLQLQKNMNSYHSISSYIKTIRKFIRVILDLDSNEPLPKQYKAIYCPRNKGKYKMFKGVEDIITPAQAFESVKKAKSKRDAFIFMLLTDAGLRPHELLNAKKRDIVTNELNYWYIQVPKASKTGFRKVRLILSIPYVEDYLKTLPKDPRTNLIDITQERLIQIVKEISKVTPYVLRHSSASFYATYLNEAELCERYGWVPGSKQVRTYVHLSQRQIDDKLNKVLKVSGVVSEPDDLEKLQPKFCLNCCSYSNFDSVNCRVCKQVLDPNEKIKKEKMDKIVYESARVLIQIAPEKFSKIAESFGTEIAMD